MGQPSPDDPSRRLGAPTATLLVVATMIGTGVFTTTGFLVRDLGSAPAVLAVWLLGGLAALAGALCYAELTAALPRNGGDYHLLSRIYHPALGFVAGWTSLIVGFAAPVAAAALAFGEYLRPIAPSIEPRAAGALVVVVLSVVHAFDVGRASGAQNAVTVPKVALIALFVVVGLALGDFGHLTWSPNTSLVSAATSPAFPVGLVFVYYAYSGWNGASYVAGEVRDPAKNLPRALIAGTLLVTLLYVGLNAAFLAAAPPETLSGVVEVAAVAAQHLFGDAAGKAVSATIAVGLVSAVGAMIMAGPRIYATMGEDYRPLRFLAARTRGGGPWAAVLLQGVLSLLMLLWADLEAIFVYVGLTLSVLSALTVLGVIVLRFTDPDLPRPYRVALYPLSPLAFVALIAWTCVHSLREEPLVALATAATLGSGLLLYGLATRQRQRDNGT